MRRPGARLLAPDVRAWLADPAQGIAGDVESVDGAEATQTALARLAPSELTVVASVALGRTCWAEITRRGDGDARDVIVGLTLDGGGSGAAGWSCSALRWCPRRRANRGRRRRRRRILESYFDDLMNSRFREAAAHFSADALYSHPPYAGGKSASCSRAGGAVARV